MPGVYRVLRHDYPLSLGIFGALARLGPRGRRRLGLEHVRLAGDRRRGAGAHGVPYVLLVESNERDARPGWRRTVKGAVVPPIVGGAAEVLVVGSLARESMRARGVPDDRISVVANTIDVARLAEAANALAPRRDTLRAEAGIDADDVVVLSVARLAPEKGLDTLVRAAVASGRAPPRGCARRFRAGAGAARVARGGARRAARALARHPVGADRRAVRRRGRVRAALAARAVGRGRQRGGGLRPAARPLRPRRRRVRPARGRQERPLVPVDDAGAAGEALRELAADPARRRAMGAASREIVAGWGYEPSIESLVAGRAPRRRPSVPSASA